METFPIHHWNSWVWWIEPSYPWFVKTYIHTRPTEYPEHIRGLWCNFPWLREPLSIKGTKQYLGWFTTSHKKTVPKPHNVFIIVVADAVAQLLFEYNIDSSVPLIAYSDSSWQDCPESGRSTGAYLIFMQGGVIDAASFMPDPVALSSAEAEYKHVVWQEQQQMLVPCWCKNFVATIPTLGSDINGWEHPWYQTQPSHFAPIPLY